MSRAERAVKTAVLPLLSAPELERALAATAAPYVLLSAGRAPEAGLLKRLPQGGFVLAERGPLQGPTALALKVGWGLEAIDVGGASLWHRSALVAALPSADGSGNALHASLIRQALLQGAPGVRARPAAGAAPQGAGLAVALLLRAAPLGWAALALLALGILIPRHALGGLVLLLVAATAFGFSFGRRR